MSSEGCDDIFAEANEEDDIQPGWITEFAVVPIGLEPALGEAPTPRVGWVYTLKNPELTARLRAEGLATEGTVLEKRKRLVSFLRNNTPAPDQLPLQVQRDSQSTMSPPVIDVNSEPLKIHEWKLSFGDRDDPASFLERLDEICLSKGIVKNRLLPYMPELLTGEPALWFRNNRASWSDWEAFERGFRIYYFPVSYYVDLYAEISRRTQRRNEAVTSYITDLQTLMRRHGKLTGEEQLEWLYRNLLPKYRQQIRKTDFSDLPSFWQAVKECDLLLKELQSEPGTTGNRSPSPRYRVSDSTEHPSTSTGYRGPSYPTQIRPNEVRVAEPRREAYPSRIVKFASQPTSSPAVCWKCGEQGHMRNDCPNPGKLFCSRCRKPGVMSRDCPCSHQGNSSEAVRKGSPGSFRQY